MTYMCFHCGFQTTDRGVFLSDQGDGRHYWTIMICPQCSLSNPPVAETTFGVAPYKKPNWVFEESNSGIYVKVFGEKGGSSANPIHSKHHLLDCMYKDGKTLREYDAWLKARGQDRNDRFRARVDQLLADKGSGKISVETYVADMDVARAECLVGPYDTRVEFRPSVL